MKKNSRCFVIAIILFIGIQFSLFAQDKLKIAIIPKSGTGVFWKSIYSGAKLGSVGLGDIEVIWKAPSRDATQPQISVVEQCIEEGVSGIVLAPLEKDSLAVPVAKAMKKKIPVLIFDSALRGVPGKDYIAFAGIDNKNAGILAGQHLAKLLGGKGNVVMLRVTANQIGIADREKGFLQALADYKDIHVIEKDRYAGFTAEDAVNESLKMGDKLRAADGVFCSYEQSTLAMLNALQKFGLAGKVKFVGFDMPSVAVEALKKGEISALVAQDPARLGYLSVKAVADYLRGKKIETTIDAGVQIVTKENLNTPEIQKLLALPGM